jgi:Family of unknown function (DUF6356)
MSISSKFTKHPASVGETYGEHLLAAMGFALGLMKAAFCCAVHALLPFLFEHTASRCIEELHQRMVVHRARTVGRRHVAERNGDAVGA